MAGATLSSSIQMQYAEPLASPAPKPYSVPVEMRSCQPGLRSGGLSGGSSPAFTADLSEVSDVGKLAKLAKGVAMGATMGVKEVGGLAPPAPPPLQPPHQPPPSAAAAPAPVASPGLPPPPPADTLISIDV